MNKASYTIAKSDTGDIRIIDRVMGILNKWQLAHSISFSFTKEW